MTEFDPSRHPDHPGKSRRHLPGLDGIRGLAILLVMFSHFIVVGDNIGKGTPISTFLHSGYLGVDLFFVLSGFLITGILIDSKSSKNYFGAFYLRRALRIFPVYYGLLTVAWLTVVFVTPGDRQVLTGANSMAWYWLYASNIGMAVKGNWLASPTWVGLGHFWSLAVEEQFYLVWPLVVYLIPVKSLKRLCLVLVLISPLVHLCLIEWFGGGAMGGRSAYVSTLNRVGVLAAGGWLAIIWREPPAWLRLEPKLIWIAAVAGTLLLLERTFFLSWMFFLEASLALVVGTACVGLAAGGSGGPWINRFFSSRILRWFGKYSYGIYVYHHALKPVWIRFIWDGWLTPSLGTGWTATLAYTATATVASLSLAWVSWKCFEGPILSLKNRFNYQN
jgi:peptidoglycan/LPS O-acetylase OafA/YrhL